MTYWGEIVVSRNGRVLRRRTLPFLTHKELSVTTAEPIVVASPGWTIATPFKWVGNKIAAFARAVWNWRATAAVRRAVATALGWVRKGFSKLGKVGTGAAAVATVTSHTGQKVVRGVAKGINKGVRLLCRAISWPFTLIPWGAGEKVKAFRTRCGQAADNAGKRIWESPAVLKMRGWMNPNTRPVRLVRDAAAATTVVAGTMAVGGIVAVIGVVLAVGYVAVRLASEFGTKPEPTEPNTVVTVEPTDEAETVNLAPGEKVTISVESDGVSPKPTVGAPRGRRADRGVTEDIDVVELEIQVTTATTDIASHVLQHLQKDPLKNRSRQAKDAYARATASALQGEVTRTYRRVLSSTVAGDAARTFLDLALKAYVDNDLPPLVAAGKSEELHAALRERAANTFSTYAQHARLPKVPAAAAS